jgi:hypothetical protein
MKRKDVREAQAVVAEHHTELFDLWINTMAKTTIAPYGAKEHSTAIVRGKQTKNAPTAVVQASYDAQSSNLVLDLQNGAHVALPISHIAELQGHSAEELAQVEVSPARDGLLWRSIDVGVSAPGLLTDFFGSAVRAQLGTVGGRRLTTAKARAARKNGAKGGRPRVLSKA